MPDASLPKRKRGAQPQNLNALKHGKYSDLYHRALTDSGRRALAIAREMSIRDLTEEAAVVRATIAELTADMVPKDLGLFADLMRTLCRVAATHYNLNKQQTDDLEDTMFNVFEDIRKTMGG